MKLVILFLFDWLAPLVAGAIAMAYAQRLDLQFVWIIVIGLLAMSAGHLMTAILISGISELIRQRSVPPGFFRGEPTE
jgi:hypothetical protein